MTTKNVAFLASLGLVATACGPQHGQVTGRMSSPVDTNVVGIGASSDAAERTADFDANGAFELELERGIQHRLWLEDRGTRTPILIGEGEHRVPELVLEEEHLDIGVIETEGEDHVARREGDPCVRDVSDCRFDTYNIEVRTGDVFVLSNFVERCEGDAGTDYVFGYEDDETWNLTAFNTNTPITIVEADLDGGNHGDGEYRISLFDADGEELDHATIRIDHDDESDVREGDDLAPPPFGEICGDEPTGGQPEAGCGADCL